MPTTEPLQGGPLPAYPDQARIPTDLAAMLDFVLRRSNMRFASVGARDDRVPTPPDGMECFTGTGSALKKWIGQGGEWVESFALYGDWDTIDPAPGWGGLSSVYDDWWVRQEGEWGATNNVLLRPTTSNLTLSAASGYRMSGNPPPGLAPAADTRGPYLSVSIRGNILTHGMLYWNNGEGSFWLIPDATVTITRLTTNQYIAIPAMRWLLQKPALPE